MNRVAVMFNPQTAPYTEEIYLPSMETAAKKLGVKQFKSLVYRKTDIEEAISGLGREPGSGLIAMTDSFMTVHRKAVIDLTLQNKLPLMYFVSIAPREGGLISYGIDLTDLFGRSASYVDRILRGAKPAELPVQLPTKFELAINLKTAKVLGLTVPTTLLTSANEVIE
jgi:putative ABC transport system substrate-binding protein